MDDIQDIQKELLEAARTNGAMRMMDYIEKHFPNGMTSADELGLLANDAVKITKIANKL